MDPMIVSGLTCAGLRLWLTQSSRGGTRRAGQAHEDVVWAANVVAGWLGRGEGGGGLICREG